MAQFKETVFLVDARGNGWSYSLYMQPNRSTPDPNTSAMNNFAKKLAKLMGTGTRFTFARESLRGSPKVSLLGEYSSNAQWAGDAAKPIEQAGSVILCQCFDAGYTKKKDIFLHGVWDTAITGGTLQAPAGWAALRDDFLTELQSGLYYFLGKTGENNEQITAVAQLGRKLQITTAAPFFPGPVFDGKRKIEVAIKGVDTVPTLPNPVLVTPTSPTTAVTKNNFLGAVLAGGTVRMNTFDLIQIKHAFFERATLHRIGRPFKPSAAGRYRRLH
jgi:hypothetical protein